MLYSLKLQVWPCNGSTHAMLKSVLSLGTTIVWFMLLHILI